MRALLSLLSLFLLLTACDKPKPADKGDQGKIMAVKDGVRAEHEHAVTCGCALDSVGHCGDYIEVDGDYIALQGVKLDDEKYDPKVYKDGMLFCKKGVMKATAKGEVKDGKYIASSFVLFKPAK